MDTLKEHFRREHSPHKQMMPLQCGISKGHQQTSQSEQQKRSHNVVEFCLLDRWRMWMDMSDEAEEPEDGTGVGVEKNEQGVKRGAVECDTDKTRGHIHAGDGVGVAEEEEGRPTVEKVKTRDL